MQPIHLDDYEVVNEAGGHPPHHSVPSRENLTMHNSTAHTIETVGTCPPLIPPNDPHPLTGVAGSGTIPLIIAIALAAHCFPK